MLPLFKSTKKKGGEKEMSKKTQEFELVSKICERPQSTWTTKEDSQVYWWYYHEMEIPAEWQLKYRIRKYRYILYFNNIKWCTFLLQCFPSEKNLDFVRNVIGYYEQQSRLCKVLKGMLRAEPLTQIHIELALKYGSKSICRKAKKKATMLAYVGQYEI